MASNWEFGDACESRARPPGSRREREGDHEQGCDCGEFAVRLAHRRFPRAATNAAAPRRTRTLPAPGGGGCLERACLKIVGVGILPATDTPDDRGACRGGTVS